jgi:aminomethyltransferase
MSSANSSTDTALARTPLYDLHVEMGAKMVSFAGYAMPVSYPPGILKEHLHTREHAGLFDVSHMGQIRISGNAAARALESLMPMDILALEPNRQRYALLTNEAGGIIDDLIVTRATDYFSLVVNASRKQDDFAYLRLSAAADCLVEERTDLALLALQGPDAAKVMTRFAPAAAHLNFMTAVSVDVIGVQCLVTRSGYTGEDGFEISVPNTHAQNLARALFEQPEVRPVGLGARDSLRLEAGLCLYGHDIDATTTPVEANLTWAMSKSRCSGFPGAEVIRRQMEKGAPRRRVGILPEGKLPLREGTVLLNDDQIPIGEITSGGFGASVNGPIAMGYLDTAYANLGSTVNAIVRGKAIRCQIVKLPFITHRYFRNQILGAAV